MSDTTELPRIDLERAAEAPIVMFDEAPVYGIMAGYGRVTLSAIVQDEDGTGGVRQRRVVVLHLRGNALAFQALREAINGMEDMLKPAPSKDQVN